MKSFAVACALLSVVPTMALAQAQASDRHTYCQVEDTGKRDIWVSRVFPTPPGDDFLGTAMATEFHRHVATLGGAGNKNCVTAVSRAAAEETRAEIAAIMGKRSFGMRVYDWHDVNWTPSAAAYANTTPATPVAATSFIHCRFVDTDKRVLLASEIFVQVLPPATDGAYYQELTRFASEFGERAAAAEGVNPAGVLCIGSDTMAEADKSRADYKKSFAFSRIRKVDLPFTPTLAIKEAAPVAAVAPAASTSGTSAAAAPTQAMGRGISDDIAAQLSSAAFFKLPEGKGESLQRAGSHIANQNVPISMDTTLRRFATGNQCQQEQTVVAGEGGMIKTRSTGLTWAGIIPLEISARMTSSYGVSDTVLHATAIDKLVGQPFPLVAGNKFGWSVSFDSALAKGAVTKFGQDWTCTVGDTAAASSTIAGLTGEQTELQCRVEFVSLPLPAQNPVYVWYSAGGCFMQDPTR